MGIGSDFITLLQMLETRGELPTEKSVVGIGAQQLARTFLEAHEAAIELAEALGVSTP